MPAHDLAETARQHTGIERPFDAQSRRNVVPRAARIELIDEPEPQLGERQGQRPLARNLDQRWEALLPAGPQSLLDPDGQVRQPRRRKELAQRHLDAEGATQARHHLGRQQRVAAQIEERVGRSNPLESEHLGPDAGKDLLDLATRGRPRSGHSSPCRARHRQGFAVELSVRREGKLPQEDPGGRHHPLGQSLGGEGPEMRHQLFRSFAAIRPVGEAAPRRLLTAGPERPGGPRPGEVKQDVEPLRAVGGPADLGLAAQLRGEMPKVGGLHPGGERGELGPQLAGSARSAAVAHPSERGDLGQHPCVRHTVDGEHPRSVLRQSAAQRLQGPVPLPDGELGIATGHGGRLGAALDLQADVVPEAGQLIARPPSFELNRQALHAAEPPRQILE